MVEAETAELQIGFEQQEERGIAVEFTVSKHLGALEPQPVAGRTAKNGNVLQPRLQRRHQNILLLGQSVGKDQRQPLAARRHAELRGEPLRLGNDIGDRNRRNRLEQNRGHPKMMPLEGDRQQSIVFIAARRDLAGCRAAEDDRVRQRLSERSGKVVRLQPVRHEQKDEARPRRGELPSDFGEGSERIIGA